jgi:hypothetical protein
MADMATVRQMVADDWKESATNLADEINTSICQALIDLRPTETSFNVGTFSFDTVVDQQDYVRHVKGVAKGDDEIRWDFWGVRGKELKLDVGKAGTDIRILREDTDDRIDRYTWLWNQSSVPSRYAVLSRGIKLAQPASSVDTVSGSCLLDLETPYPKYTGGAWTYIGADGNAINTSTFTNAWFTNCAQLIASRAAYRMLNNHLHDQKRAAMALGAYQSELRDLIKGEAASISMGSIRPSLY